MNQKPLLALQDVTGGYGDVTVVQDVSLHVDPGQAVCVTGRNGVGKSTLVKLIAGQLPALSGTATFDDEDITRLPDHGRRALGLGYAPQESVVFDTLSILENLTLHYPDRDLSRYAGLFSVFPRMEERLTQLAGHQRPCIREQRVLLHLDSGPCCLVIVKLGGQQAFEGACDCLSVVVAALTQFS